MNNKFTEQTIQKLLKQDEKCHFAIGLLQLADVVNEHAKDVYFKIATHLSEKERMAIAEAVQDTLGKDWTVTYLHQRTSF